MSNVLEIRMTVQEANDIIEDLNDVRGMWETTHKFYDLLAAFVSQAGTA